MSVYGKGCNTTFDLYTFGNRNLSGSKDRFQAGREDQTPVCEIPGAGYNAIRSGPGYCKRVTRHWGDLNILLTRVPNFALLEFPIYPILHDSVKNKN